MPGLDEARTSGPWQRGEIDAFLAGATIPLRLAVVNAEGWPLVASLWFTVHDAALWCATNQSALIVRLLAADGRCAFEIAGDSPPYRGLRGQGRASLHPDQGAAILEALLARYAIRESSRLAQKLRAKVAEEVAIRIAPEWISSWDFTRRMHDAVGKGSGLDHAG
jgi:Pyridoxamine 5'-phosphate oxidase